MKDNKIFAGIIVIALAAIYLMNKMGFMADIGIWSIFFSVFFVYTLGKGLLKIDFAKIILSIAFLCIIWNKQLGLEAITPWPILFASVLIIIGLNLIFGRMKVKINMDRKVKIHIGENGGNAKVEQDSGEEVDCKVKFGGLQKYIESGDLRRVNISAFCGGAEIYMDKACVPSGEVIVTVECKCSGVQIYIPKDWNVVNKIQPSLSGFSIEGEPSGAGIIDVVLIGDVSLSGFQITYV